MAERRHAAAPERESVDTRIAILLAVAAIVSSLAGARAATIAGAAADDWQSAVRIEARESSIRLLNGITVYGIELPFAARIMTKQAAAEAYPEQPASTPELRDRLQSRASVAVDIAEILRGTEFVPERYVRGGTFDLERRLVDSNRDADARNAEGAAAVERGDNASRRSLLLVLAAIPAAVAFLLGALAEAFPRRRRPLVGSGAALVALAVTALVVLEVTA